MGNGQDNAARKKTAEELEAERLEAEAAVDAGWELPEAAPDKTGTPDQGVSGGTSYIHELIESAMKDPTTQKLQIEEKKQMRLPGAQFLVALLKGKPKRGEVLIESGEARPAQKEMKIRGSTLTLRTVPGEAKEKEGKMVYPVSRDGIVAHDDKASHEITIGTIHTHGYQTKDQILANLATADMAYLLTARAGLTKDQPELRALAAHMQQTVSEMNDSMKEPSKEMLAVLMARLDRHYGLEVLSAGDNHCLIVKPGEEKVESSRVQTMEDKLMEEFSAPHLADNLEEYAKKHGLDKVLNWLNMGLSTQEMHKMLYDMYEDPSQYPFAELEKMLTTGLGKQEWEKEFQPSIERFKVTAGDIILLISGPAMEALKLQDKEFSKAFKAHRAKLYISESKFADEYFGHKIMAELKQGKSLQEVVDELMQKVSSYREIDSKGRPLDTTVTVVSYEVPQEI